jgi:predicted amidophosphoribosyltransferase
MIKMSQARRMLLAENARQENPLPVCPGCQMPFQEADAGELRLDLCFSCEARYVYAILWRAVRAYGRPAALRRLRAVGRLPRHAEAGVAV